jgi:GDP/UDP-N,N'-diacetylbacillosamine 2-epimerase (hydrolysing)
MRKARNSKRRICFVTGTRAEFGLMVTTLQAIKASESLQIQIVATGTHLDPKRGMSIEQIRAEGFEVDAVIPWAARKGTPFETAMRTGEALAKLAETFGRLGSEIVLVVGDRVEAFAAAAAGCIGGQIVAHVHGGDRALGQVDDSLRHAITKLAHLHFPATQSSADRIEKLGEDRWRIKRVGSPGIDGIVRAARSSRELMEEYGLQKHRFALLLLHPTEADPAVEYDKGRMVVAATVRSDLSDVVAIAPNNDPGADGILKCWKEQSGLFRFVRDLPRTDFLGLLRDAALLVGNSSSGIIEAASFGTPVIDLGDRQHGRERSKNVTNVPFNPEKLHDAIVSAFKRGHSRRFAKVNVYGGAGTGDKIARHLAAIQIDSRLQRKLIAY